MMFLELDEIGGLYGFLACYYLYLEWAICIYFIYMELSGVDLFCFMKRNFSF